MENEKNLKPPCENIIIHGILKGLSCSHGVKMVKYLPSTTTTTTPELINLKNTLISLITAIGVALILALTKKVYETITFDNHQPTNNKLYLI